MGILQSPIYPKILSVGIGREIIIIGLEEYHFEAIARSVEGYVKAY
jgi:hypothetical protein